MEMFWPRFMFVIEQNIESIRTIDPQKMGSIDVQPHYVSTVGTIAMHTSQISFKMTYCTAGGGGVLPFTHSFVFKVLKILLINFESFLDN